MTLVITTISLMTPSITLKKRDSQSDDTQHNIKNATLKIITLNTGKMRGIMFSVANNPITLSVGGLNK
jgi:hypothetical protein